MFESAKIEHKLDKATFKEMEPELREDLLNAQFQLIDKKRHLLLVLIHGPDGAGKGAVLNRLYHWLDARKLRTLTYESCSKADRSRPPLWRYWRDLPPFGEIGIMLGSWYHEPLCKRALGLTGRPAFLAELEALNRFEAMLHAEGVHLLKLSLYLGADEARARFKALSKKSYERPVVREWGDVDTPKQRARLTEAAEESARLTSTDIAPWHMVPALDDEYRDAMVGRLLLEKLRAMDLETTPAPPPQEPYPARVPNGLPHPSILSTLDLSLTLDEKRYDKQIHEAQHRITRLTTSKAFEQRGLVVVFEGSDAAGKSSTIMRLRRALDPRRFRVHPIAAPSDADRARPYLWRFWRHVPARGHTAIFDRSWYGRVLVERVEGFCTPADWGRAYGEINDFEDQLEKSGLIVIKFWLAISQEEQARRFEAREVTSYKRFKLTPEDWRNREKWPLYEAAVTEMVDRTSTQNAPWTLVEMEDKLYGRAKVVRTVADRLEEALGG